MQRIACFPSSKRLVSRSPTSLLRVSQPHWRAFHVNFVSPFMTLHPNFIAVCVLLLVCISLCATTRTKQGHSEDQRFVREHLHLAKRFNSLENHCMPRLGLFHRQPSIWSCCCFAPVCWNDRSSTSRSFFLPEASLITTGGWVVSEEIQHGLCYGLDIGPSSR